MFKMLRLLLLASTADKHSVFLKQLQLTLLKTMMTSMEMKVRLLMDTTALKWIEPEWIL